MEILAGNGIEQAFAALEIDAQCGYKSDSTYYQVWKLKKEDFQKLCSVDDADWLDDWGWWRGSDGSNMDDSTVVDFMVNGQLMKGWKDQFDFDDTQMIVYRNLLTYFSNEIGASTERNVCALSVDLAQMNDMSMAELFAKYQ